MAPIAKQTQAQAPASAPAQAQAPAQPLVIALIKKKFHEVFNIVADGEKLYKISTPVEVSANGRVINSSHIFQKSFLEDFTACYKAGVSILLTGEAGVGKTSSVREYFSRTMGVTPISFSCSESTSVADFVGMWKLVDGETVFQYGCLAKAMKEGIPLLLNEVDMLPPQEFAILNDVLEGLPLYIKEIDETIVPAKGFVLVGTANSCGNGSGDYAGVSVQNKATYDRFAIIEMKPLPQKAEEAFVKQMTGLPVEICEGLVKLARATRVGLQEGEYSLALSPRGLKNMGGIIKNLNGSLRDRLHRAYCMTYVLKLDTSEREAGLKLFDVMLGTC